MKTNSKYWEKITAYYSNELSEEESRAIEAWAELYDGKELLMEMNTKMKQIEESEYMYNAKTDLAWDKLNSRIKQEAKPEKAFLSIHRNFIGIAATVIILLSIGFGIFKLVNNDLKLNHLQTAFYQSQVELSDGTIVLLNGNSSLEYPSKFNGDSRLVKLVGEAYFDVKADKNYPFIIETDKVRIQVVGTSFNVRSTGLKGDVEVLVTSGKVRLQDMQNPGQELILEKGDFASLANNKLQNKKVNDENYLAWKTKMLAFDKTPLLDVIQTINRAYAIQVDLADEKLGELPLTSKYNQMEVGSLLDAMCLTFNLSKKIEEDRIILYSSKR